MAKKTNQQQVKAAISTGNKLTQSEIRNLQNAGISMNQILTVAAKNKATIGDNAQQVYNVDQNKRGAISYTPSFFAEPPKPGSGWAVTGFQSAQSRSPNGGISTTQIPTYTYMAPTTVKVTQASPSPSPDPNQNQNTDPNASPSPATGNWWDSITEGINGVLTTITDSINANNRNNDLYMGDIRDLINQMSAMPAQQTMAPYAVTTTNNAPAQGAQMTQAISRRLKNLSTSLAIAPSESAAAGAGLNIPV